MHITCVICSEMFIENSEICATACGHVFHKACLNRWFENSNTCPQCRRRLNTKELVKLYMNIGSTMNAGLDASMVMNEVQSAQLNVLLKERQLKELRSEKSDLKKINQSLSASNMEYAAKCDSQKSTINGLKLKLKHFKDAAKNCQLLRLEIANLKKEIGSLNSVSVALKGSREDVRHLIRNEKSIENLAVVAAALKKSLVQSHSQNKKLQARQKKTQSELLHVKNDLSKAQDECNAFIAALNGAPNNHILSTNGTTAAAAGTATATETVDPTVSPSSSRRTVLNNPSMVEVANSPGPSSRMGVLAMQRSIGALIATFQQSESASAAASRPIYKRPNMLDNELGGSPTGERKRAKMCASKPKKLFVQAGKPGKK